MNNIFKTVSRLRLQSAITGLLLLLIIACSGSVLADDGDGSFDSTRVRKTTPVKKSTGEIIADIPGELLKLPVRILEYTVYGVATNPPISYLGKIVKFSGPAHRYVPVIGFSTHAGLKLGFGLRRLKKDFWTDRLYFKWYYSTHNYQSYKFRYRVHELFTKQIGLDVYYRYKKRTRESFFGIGNSSLETAEVNYTHEHSELKIDLPLHANQQFSIGLTGGFLITNLTDGKDPDHPGELQTIFANPDLALTLGHIDGARYIRFGGRLEYDSRNHGGQPSDGVHLLSQVVRYVGTGRSDKLKFVETTIDLRHYLNVWRRRILATRFYLKRFRADENNLSSTPINLVSQLGGEDRLRGYSAARFVDNDMALISAEWRFPLWNVLDGFVFLDEGRVYEDLTVGKFFSDWKYSAGGGLRIWNSHQVSLITTVAASDEGARVYIATSAVW